MYQRILALLTGQSLKTETAYSNNGRPVVCIRENFVQNFLGMTQIGSPDTVKNGLKQLLEKYQVDEFIFTCDIYDTQKRLDNFSLLMDLKK